MGNLYQNNRVLILLFVLLNFFIIFLLYYSGTADIERSSAQEDVTVAANVVGCELELVVYPENRIPVSGNWGTSLNVEVYLADPITYLGTTTSTSNDPNGKGNFDLCSDSIFAGEDDYLFYIRGKSHLRKKYGPITTFGGVASYVNFSTTGGLIAGETSNIYDNYINSLDLATQIATLETNDDKNDLNQDGEVNVLDISVTIGNYFKEGDCSPREQQYAICN
ncbi:hypothetical protein KC669_00980 [Candidatus Dojkabacteria bacterium]|uniref:Dockerin domain-containing protein n=1 Tax=Candidatus Dojkabacteria bacterium TaxID=2099670 RepID=A0A955L9F3_9BACT|nr:hypothetical protein [Candidatus Dojkabacteria bacterium]